MSITETIENGVRKFVSKQEELLGLQGFLSKCKLKVLLFVQKRICCLSMLHSSSWSSLCVPSIDLDHLKIFHVSFAISCMN
jgi:hypothetical protein